VGSHAVSGSVGASMLYRDVGGRFLARVDYGAAIVATRRTAPG
jgi:hypothetical protein